MGIKVGESGKIFRYGTSFDMSSSTSLELKFTNPAGVEISVTNPKVTAPAVGVTDPDVGPLVASEYMEFDIEATDFITAGSWSVCGIFTNTATTPDQIYHGDSASFTVSEAC